MVGGGNNTASGAMDFTANNVANLAAPTSSRPVRQHPGQRLGVRRRVQRDHHRWGRSAERLLRPGRPGRPWRRSAGRGDTRGGADCAHGASGAGSAASQRPPAIGYATSTTVTEWIGTGTTTTSGRRLRTPDVAKDVGIIGALSARTRDHRARSLPGGTTFIFKKLYMATSLQPDPDRNVKVSATFLRVDGTITDQQHHRHGGHRHVLGAVYVGGTGASSVAGKVTISGATPSFYTGGRPHAQQHRHERRAALRATATSTCPATRRSLSRTPSTRAALSRSTTRRRPSADKFGSVYVNGTAATSASGTVTLEAGSSFYTGGPLTLSNTATYAGQLYARATSPCLAMRPCLVAIRRPQPRCPPPTLAATSRSAGRRRACSTAWGPSTWSATSTFRGWRP